MFIRRCSLLLSLRTLVFLLTPGLVHATGICSPHTWDNNKASPPTDLPATTTTEDGPSTWTKPSWQTWEPHWTMLQDSIAVGSVNCRYWAHMQPADMTHGCDYLVRQYKVPLNKFFMLNPELERDCSNLVPNRDYCVEGYIQPLEAGNWGSCGPFHNNASCRYTSTPCCNSETWKCGNTWADCTEGVCWEGLCAGHTYYSTDGKCGRDHGDVKCTGKWGDCCHDNGTCGTGPEFCGEDCQSGNCSLSEELRFPGEWGDDSWRIGNSTDGMCGGENAARCGVLWGECCSKWGECGSEKQHCEPRMGCQPQFGRCNFNFTSIKDIDPPA